MARRDRQLLSSVVSLGVGLFGLLLAVSACSDRSGQADVVEAPSAPVGSADQLSGADAGSTASLTTSTTELSTSTSTAAPDDEPAWAFVPSGMTPEFRRAAAAVDGVESLAQVDVAAVNIVSSRNSRGRTINQLVDGFRIQLDARAYRDRGALARLVPAAANALDDFDGGQVLLPESSAELRELDEGSVITFDSGWSATVAGVVADEIFGSVEIVFVDPEDLVEAGAVSIRPGLLIDYQGPAVELEAALLDANGGDGVRVFGGRDSAERDLPTPVLSPLEVKLLFGEFSFRPSVGRSVKIEDAWFEENIELRRIPIIGRVRCHRIFNDALAEVMAGLVRDGLEDMIDTSAYQGCWTPRFIGGSQRLSRHSWGIAADINFGNDPDYSLGSPVHPILLNRMAEAGLVSGHRWVNADPGHFEYVGEHVGG